MSVIKLKAKVKLVSEEDMELEEMDMGIIAKSKEWVWRQLAIKTDEIYKVISYSSTKSILQMYDGEKILVAEAFDSLSERWKQLIDIVIDDADYPVYNDGDETLDSDESS